MAKRAALYVEHLMQAIANIETDIAGHDLDSFRSDRRTRQLVERNLEILSEASRRLPEAFKDEEPGIDWPAIAGIGNVLRHDYHASQPAILWETGTRDLKLLKAAVQRIRDRLKERKQAGSETDDA